MTFEAELLWDRVAGVTPRRCPHGAGAASRASSWCEINRCTQGQQRGQSPAPQVPVMRQEEQEMAGKCCRQPTGC